MPAAGEICRGRLAGPQVQARLLRLSRRDPGSDPLILPAFTVTCDRPWLVAEFAENQRLLGWAMHRPGLVDARRVIWREVRNADLPPPVDPAMLLRDGLAAIGALDAVAMMTSRDIRRHEVATHAVDGVTAACLATVGLGNGERVGRRRHARPGIAGTVNLLCHVSSPLTDAAMLEALSIAAQARTLAILEGGHRPDPDLPPVTGTGTDCIVMASPAAGPPTPYAGLHTAVGEAIGAAVLGAVRAGVSGWMIENGDP